MKPRKISIAVIIIFSFSAITCKTQQGIIRGIKPVETLKTKTERNRCSVITSKNYEISIEPINKSHWGMIDVSKLFFKNNKSLSNTRLPRLAFFQIIISNTGRNPIEIKNISLKNNNINRTNLSLEEVENKCKSPVYSIFKFDKILSNKRLFSSSMCPKKIDYKIDTIDYNLQFILPQDKIIKIVAFEWIPVEYRKFSIEIKLKSLNNDNNNNKNIAVFDFTRFEYRTKGRVFTRPEKEDTEVLEYVD